MNSYDLSTLTPEEQETIIYEDYHSGMLTREQFLAQLKEYGFELDI